MSKDRRKNEDDTPEWFHGGPTSQHDTIELRGFDDEKSANAKTLAKKEAAAPLPKERGTTIGRKKQEEEAAVAAAAASAAAAAAAAAAFGSNGTSSRPGSSLSGKASKDNHLDGVDKVARFVYIFYMIYYC